MFPDFASIWQTHIQQMKAENIFNKSLTTLAFEPAQFTVKNVSW